MLLSMMGEYLAVLLLQTAGTPAYRESVIIKNGAVGSFESTNLLDVDGEA
jgi:hypothetical protein